MQWPCRISWLTLEGEQKKKKLAVKWGFPTNHHKQKCKMCPNNSHGIARWQVGDLKPLFLDLPNAECLSALAKFAPTCYLMMVFLKKLPRTARLLFALSTLLDDAIVGLAQTHLGKSGICCATDPWHNESKTTGCATMNGDSGASSLKVFKRFLNGFLNAAKALKHSPTRIIGVTGAVPARSSSPLAWQVAAAMQRSKQRKRRKSTPQRKLGPIVYVCVCLCVFACLRVCVSVCLRACVFAYLRVCICVLLCVSAFACLSARLRVCVFACLLVCVFGCLGAWEFWVCGLSRIADIFSFRTLFLVVFGSYFWRCSLGSARSGGL